jgi:hypothetical protein
MKNLIIIGAAWLAASALPVPAAGLGWHPEFARKLEITSDTACRLTLKQRLAGTL